LDLKLLISHLLEVNFRGEIMLVKCGSKGKVFGAANFMTPVILGFFESGDYYFELSTSPGAVDYMEIDRIYGVTVAKDRVHLREKSKCFGSRAEAESYMREFVD
jgi:hypothetical protein